jgi:hypothetical protein
MIRIDENTYIDDTLVTCAEYQLFIDEMREQGKYFQPDHWTTYQFPVGQARAPIVGVRFRDAKTFCEWLTRREAAEWNFYIPTNALAIQYPLITMVQSPLGYWTVPDDEGQFTWIGSAPANPRNLDFDSVLTIALNRARKSAHNFASSIANTADSTRMHEFTRKLEHSIDLARDRARNVILDRPLDLDHNIDLVHDWAHNILLLDHPFDRTLKYNLSSALDYTSERAIYHALELVFAHVNDRERAIEFEQPIFLELYLDLYTVQERIAGRSPAFEGIRLVKERKKQ